MRAARTPRSASSSATTCQRSALLTLVVDLQVGMRVIGEAENGERAVVEAERLQPDVILLDMSMPVRTGLDALPEIKRVAARKGDRPVRARLAGGDGRRSRAGCRPLSRERRNDRRCARVVIPLTPARVAQTMTRYTWNTSAYSRFTLMPCVRATFHTYSGFA